jgi:Xaa-Pro aminopeptidase
LVLYRVDDSARKGEATLPKKAELGRRELLKGSLVAASAALVGGGVGSVISKASTADGSTPSLPPEVVTVNSKEYGQKRIQKFQDGVRKAGLDALIISNRAFEYVGYPTNYHPSAREPGVAFIPAAGNPVLFVQMYSSAHARMAKRTIWMDDVVDVPKDTVSETNSLNFYKAVVSTLNDRKLAQGRIGLAGGEVDWMLPPYFHEKLPKARTENANRLLWSLVVTRDDTELAIMKWTARLSDEIAFPLIKKMCVPGTNDRELVTDVVYALLNAGSDGPHLSFGAAPYSEGIWATPPQDRKIQTGDIVLCEPIVPLRHYQTERMYTFSVGKNQPDSQKRGAQVVYESFQLALEEMKPGRDLGDVFTKCNDYIKSKGYPEGSTVLIGHFIGMDNHEGGRITAEGGKGVILQPGMVISWHPNVVVPGEGGVRTICSSSLLITQTGVEMMSKIPMEPMIYV